MKMQGFILFLAVFVILGAGPAMAERTIYGSVKDVFGKPVAGVLIKAYDSDRNADDYMGTASSDSRGNYKIVYKKKRWDTKVPGTTKQFPDIYVVAYVKFQGRHVKVKRSGVMNNRRHKYNTNINLKLTGISGTIKDSRGQPAAGLLVSAWDNDGSTKSQIMGEAVTDKYGRYTIFYERKNWDNKIPRNNSWLPDIFIKIMRQDAISGRWVNVEGSKINTNWNMSANLKIDLTIPESRTVMRQRATEKPPVFPSKQGTISSATPERTMTKAPAQSQPLQSRDQTAQVFRMLPPDSPSQLRVEKYGIVSSGSPVNYAILMWHDNASNETEYIIERKSSGSFTEVGRTGPNIASFEDTSVTWSDATYWWRVRARNAAGYSGYSETYLTQLADPNHNPVGGTQVLEIPESAEDMCKAEGGMWIGWGVNYCSKTFQTIYGAAQTLVNPIVQVYKAYFAIVAGGAEMYSLPQNVVTMLKPFYGETLLKEVKFGASNHTSSENTAMTDCKKIYFPAGSGVVADLKNDRILNKNDNGEFLFSGSLHWLLHELKHVRQCVDRGGRENYGILWFSELHATTIEELITNPTKVSNKKIHDSMPMEENAEAGADQVLLLL